MSSEKLIQLTSSMIKHPVFFSVGQIRAVRRMTKHFNGPSVDRIPSCRSPMARHIVMVQQHGLQKGSSFLPHGSKEVSVQYLVVRNVNYSKRSTKTCYRLFPHYDKFLSTNVKYCLISNLPNSSNLL